MASTVSDRNLRGNDFSVGISPQAAYGAIDASPVFRPLRRTTGKPETTVSYAQDDSVSTDNQGVENIQDSTEYTMELASSFSKQAVSLLISAIHAVVASSSNVAATYAATATGFTLSPAMYTAIAVGDAFWVSGFANSAIDGLYIVLSKDGANSITTTIAPPATELAGASVTFTSNKSANGLSPTYYAVQERVTDTGAVGGIAYTTYYDQVINEATIEIGETGITTDTFNFLGERRVAGEVAVAGQTYSAKLTDRAVSNAQNITAWYVDGLKATCIQKSMTITAANGYAGDDAAGCARQYARGQFAVTGSAAFRAKISDPLVWRAYYEQGIRKSLGVLITHPNTTDQTFIVMRQCAITEHSQADGNSDVSNHEISFGAEGDSVTSSTIQIFTNWTVTN
jgi:hypothetical protein